MSSLGHLSPSTLDQVKLGMRPASAKPASPRPRPQPQPQNRARTSAAPDEKSANADTASVDEYEEDSSHSIRRMLPACLFSMVFHVVVLLVLALLTLSMVEKPRDKGLVVSPTDPELETEEILDDIELIPEESDLKENFEPAEVADIAAIEITEPGTLGDAPQIDPLDTMLTGPLFADAVDWTELGSEFGKGDKGMGKDGLGPPISFFGVKTKGNKFMFVVDNSNSMQGGKFETAVAELTKSVNALSASQQFYIIFYSDTAYPLFYPTTAKTWVRATAENKVRVQSWLSQVERCLKTNGGEAFDLAFSMKPDVLYLLGDGAFTDKPVPKVLATKDDKIVIHTLGFGLKRGRTDFEAIAKKFKGTFTDVQVTPEMVQLSKRLNRPKNNRPKGVWGLKLGDRKKKQKK